MNNRCTYSRTVRVRRTERVARRRSTSRANEVVYQCARCTSSFQCVCASQSDARTHTHARSHTSTHVYSVTLHRVLFYFFFLLLLSSVCFLTFCRVALASRSVLSFMVAFLTQTRIRSLSLFHTHTHTHTGCASTVDGFRKKKPRAGVSSRRCACVRVAEVSHSIGTFPLSPSSSLLSLSPLSVISL